MKEQVYTKQSQTTKTEVTHKICGVCGKKRAIKFFSSKRARSCSDCKRKKWAKQLRESPGRLNKKKDKQWADDVKKIAGYKCEYCGSTERLNAHHIFSRSNRAVRWSLDNGICLCSLHHVFSTTFSAHKASVEFITWLIEKRGQAWFDKLRKKAISIKGENEKD